MTDPTKTKKLPPQAKGAVPYFNHALKFQKDMYGFLRKNCDELGPIFSFKLMKKTYYVINHPDFAKQIMVDNVKNYSRKKAYESIEELLGHGLITTEGEEWKRHRRIAQPSFHKEKLEILLQQMEECTEKFISAWGDAQTKKVDLEKEMSHITLSILSNSIIQTDLEENFQELKQNLSDTWNYLSKKRFRSAKLFGKNEIPPDVVKAGKAAIANLKKTMFAIIEKRRNSGGHYTDLLAMLMAATDEETKEGLNNEELMDEVMTLFIAGHDTTAVVLTWMFYLLATHPEIEKRIVAEIDEKWTGTRFTMKELMNFPYTKMVIQETMRLYPPVWTFGRRAVNEDMLGEFYVPAGCPITLPSLFIHRNAAYWERPDEFYPEHFTPERIKAQKRFSYFPFGGGQHLCIGEHYAYMEMQLIIIYLLKKYKIKIENKKPVGMNLLLTIRPTEPIWISFTKR